MRPRSPQKKNSKKQLDMLMKYKMKWTDLMNKPIGDLKVQQKYNKFH